MSRSHPNQCRDNDSSAPLKSAPPVKVRTAADLSDRQLWLCLEVSLGKGGEAADHMWYLFRFEPTAADRVLITQRIQEKWNEWWPWIKWIDPAAQCPQVKAMELECGRGE